MLCRTHDRKSRAHRTRLVQISPFIITTPEKVARVTRVTRVRCRYGFTVMDRLTERLMFHAICP